MTTNHSNINTKVKVTLLVVLFLAAFLSYAHFAFGTFTVIEPSPNKIDSFQECADAGYPIMESYPEQCAVPGGKTYTKEY